MTFIHSKLLGETVEINAVCSGPTAYTRTEISVLLALKADEQTTRDIHRIKKHFNGEVVGVTKIPQAHPRRTWHGTSWTTPVL